MPIADREINQINILGRISTRQPIQLCAFSFHFLAQLLLFYVSVFPFLLLIIRSGSVIWEVFINIIKTGPIRAAVKKKKGDTSVAEKESCFKGPKNRPKSNFREI